jgi:ribosomal protein S27E
MLRRGTGFLDTSEITVMCPDCRQESTSRLGEVKRAQTITCTSCGAEIRIDRGLDAMLLQIEIAGSGI